ncbi:malonyl-[acyl-carrier protein] O-methyltransferase BioC, partial [Campylobacter jejuni]|nr:malonyl-[acyl-carrier protein] O-methyltransferase BioC [Campylobacter jejuni]
KEIKQSTGFGLNYFSLNELEQIFKVYFDEVKITQELIELSFNNTLDVFRHLKLSGVNSLGFYPLNKSFLKEFEEKFQNKLTYHPVFILCKNDIK